MSVLVVCECQSRFELRDEFAGTLVECPACGRQMVAGATVASAVEDPVFGREVFLLRQKTLSISERYTVTDEAGAPLLYVERPAHLVRGILATIGGLVAALFAFLALASAISPFLPEAEADAVSPAANVIAILIMVSVGIVFVVVAMALSRKRHVSFHEAAGAGRLALEVLQDRKVQFPTRTFTVRDGEARPIGTLSKNHLYSVFRKRWMITDARGRPLASVREDSIILSLIRRVGAFVPILRLMRTNFLFFRFGTDRDLGEFRRKRTILDRYVLDMAADPTRSLDRRLAVAMAVMLDTAERR